MLDIKRRLDDRIQQERTMRERELVKREQLETVRRIERSRREQSDRAQQERLAAPSAAARAEELLLRAEALTSERNAQAGQQKVVDEAPTPPNRPPTPPNHFEDKEQLAERLAKGRYERGEFDVEADDQHARAQIFASERGQNSALDASARLSVMRDWLPKEFELAQQSIEEREKVLNEKLESLNRDLPGHEKISAAQPYERVDIRQHEDVTSARLGAAYFKVVELDEIEDRVREAEKKRERSNDENAPTQASEAERQSETEEEEEREP